MWIRSKKKLLIAVSCLVVLIVSVLLALPFLVDQTAAKDFIVSRLESSLQRKVSVQAVEITVFSGIGVRLSKVLISEDPRVGSNGFMQVESLKVRPSLFPLLRGRIEFSSIQAVKPIIRLVRNAAGVWNFSSLAKRTEETGQPKSTPPTAAPSNSTTWAISMLTMVDGTLSVRDQVSRTQSTETQYEHIDAALTGVSLNTPTSFVVDLQIPGTGKRTLRAKGEWSPLGSASSKNFVKARVEFSEVPLADLRLLLLPTSENNLPWEGKLTTETQVQGDWAGTLQLEGVSRFATLRSVRSGQEGLDLSGDLQYKLSYEVNSGTIHFETAKLALPNSQLELTGNLKPHRDSTLLDLKIDSQKAALDDLLKFSSVFGQGPPKGVKAKGDGSFHLHVAGSSVKPEIDGQCNFAKSSIRYPGIKEEIALSPLALSFKSPALSSNEVLISLGERTRINTQFSGNLGAEKFLSLNLRTQNPVPVADLQAIGSSFGVSLPQGYSLQNGTINLQVLARIPLSESSAPNLTGRASLAGSQLRLPVFKVPLDVTKADASFTGNSLMLSDLVSTLNGSKLSGKLQCVNFASPSLVFALNIDQLDLDSFISILNTPPENVKVKKASLLEKIRNSALLALPAGRRVGGEECLVSSGNLVSNAENPCWVQSWREPSLTTQSPSPPSPSPALGRGEPRTRTFPQSPLQRGNSHFPPAWYSTARWVASLVFADSVYASTGTGRTAVADPLARVVISDSRASIQRVKYGTFTFSEVSSKVRMKNRSLELNDLQFKMNRGIHNGVASFDFSGPQPRYTLSSKLKNVDSNEFLSQNTSLKNLLYGPLSLDLDVSAGGSGLDEFIRQMKGRGNLNLVNGRITSFDLMEKIAAFGKLAGINVEQGGTTITSLIAPFQIADGLVSTENLQMRTPSASVRAAGSFGLENKNVDYRILAELPYTPGKGNDLATQLMNFSSGTFFKTDKGNVGVPLRMTGNISKPVFALDTQVVQENLKNRLMKEGPKSLESLQNLLRSKKSGESSPSDSSKDQPSSSPLEELLKGVLDKAKKKQDQK